MTSFDDFGQGLFSVFQVATLQDWTSLAYGYMDGDFPEAAVFFIVIIVFANFFVINMTFRCERAAVWRVGGRRGDRLCSGRWFRCNSVDDQPQSQYNWLWVCVLMPVSRLCSMVYVVFSYGWSQYEKKLEEKADVSVTAVLLLCASALAAAKSRSPLLMWRVFSECFRL